MRPQAATRGKHWAGRRELWKRVAMSLSQGEDTGVIYRIVRGALFSTINDHGPIQRHDVDSATKRIVQQLRGWCYNDDVKQSDEAPGR